MIRGASRLRSAACIAYGLWLSRRFTLVGPQARVRVKWPVVPVHVRRHPSAVLEVRGVLTFESWLGTRKAIGISCAEGSRLIVGGDFTVGNGVRFSLSRRSLLEIGGRKTESAAGITEGSLFLVRRHVEVGTDLLCAWNVFVTDCDWHPIEGKLPQEDTIIEDHVWLAPNCCILKGSRIGQGTVVAAGAVVHRMVVPPGSLIAGVPARLVGSGQRWSRDLPPGTELTHTG